MNQPNYGYDAPELEELAESGMEVNSPGSPEHTVCWSLLFALRKIKEMSAELEALRKDAERMRTALRIAREGYASEAATGLPVLPQWRERTMALIDAAMSTGATHE